MALRKVRDNLDRLFDKNLTDLIRGIRNNRENEARYIASCIEEIKTELRQESTYVKANAIEKLAYLQMLGYDISWSSFNIIEVMASTRFNEKRIGYLAATQCFNDETDVLMLTTNMIRKDLQSSQLYDVGVALSGLACFATADLSRDLVNDVVNLLSSSRPYVRKKAVLLLYKIFLKYPECLRPTFSRLKERLDDSDPGVQSAAVNVICELARKNPRNYLSLAPTFFKLMTTSSNNWMLIKIIKLFGSLVPLESRLGRKLLEPLTTLINSTSAMSLLYECINTVIAVLISISSEGPGDHTASIQLCVQKLGVLIEDSDQNLKYLGLLAMGRILQTHPKAVQAHKDIVLRCLDDKDESIRLRALDLLYGMVSRKNIMEIVKKLMEHVDAAEGSYYRDELLSRIISICSYNNYQYISNFEWYISVLVELTKVEGSKHGVLIAQQIQDVTIRVQSIRHFSVSQMALLVENAHLLLSTNSTQKKNICEVLLVAAWICGEYAEHVQDPLSVLVAMLRTKISIAPGELLSVYVQNIAKLYSLLLLRHERADDWDAVESLDNLILSKLPEFQYSSHLEAQERACNLVAILKLIEQKHLQHEKMSEPFAALFEGELNPVAAKAQKRVPVPEGLDLNAWIVEPEPETEPESSDEEHMTEFPSIDTARQQFAAAAHSYLYSDDEDKEQVDEIAEEALPSTGKSKKRKSKEQSKAEIEESRRRRQFEQENNPYYVKSTTKKAPTADAKTSIYQKASKRREGTIGEVQSPLEIPGVIGMTGYMEQQKSTLSWANAKSEKKSRRGKSKTKRGKKRAASSSDEADESVVVHQVNRDDGEMPENALSSNDEKETENEFKALDINLDEPLREDEKLFAPKPYTRPEHAFNDHHSFQTANILPKNPKRSNGKEAEEESSKKSKKHKTSSKLKEKKTKEKEPKAKKAKKKRLEVEDNQIYNAIESPSAEPEQHQATPKTKAKRLKSGGKGKKKSVEDILVPGSTLSAKFLSTSNSAGYIDLCSNGRLALSYAAKVAEVDMHRVALSIRIHNNKLETVRRLEISVSETQDIKLEGGMSQDSSSVVLPFELPARTCNEQTIHLNFGCLNSTHRVRASLTYFVESSTGDCAEEKIDCKFLFPAVRFLRYATIGSTSYEFMLGSGELLASSTPTCESDQSLKAVVDEIGAKSNFSVVEFMDDAVSLYAHDWDDKPVCVLLKKKDKFYSVSCKCADRQLAQSIVEDIIDVIREV